MSSDAVVAVPSAPAPASTPKKPAAAAKGGLKKQRVKPTHPRTSEMVNAAIKDLKERGGSSLQAIKKYISANYKIDAEKLAPFIKKYLKSAVTSGSLVQTKGKGASGSFKLAAGEKVGPATEKKAVSKSVARTQKPKQKRTKQAAKKAPPAKKSTAVSVEPKKKAAPSAGAKKPAAASKAKAAKSPTKAKKASKVPTKKPKAPKPKKVAKPKSAAAKKSPKKK